MGQILDRIIIYSLESHFHGYAKPCTVLLIIIYNNNNNNNNNIILFVKNLNYYNSYLQDKRLKERLNIYMIIALDYFTNNDNISGSQSPLQSTATTQVNKVEPKAYNGASSSRYTVHV